MKRKPPKGWIPHVLDDLNPATLSQKLKARGITARSKDRSPEANAARKRMRKLNRIARLESESTGKDITEL